MTDRYHYPGQELELFEEATNWKRYLAKQVRPFIKGSVLEVGAGISETTPFLLTENVSQWLCLEPDEHLYKTVEQKISEGKLPAYCKARYGTLKDIDAVEKFDTIIYIDVLEHIERDEDEVDNACFHLKEDGHLIILSPAFQFLYNPFDKVVGHHRRYTKTTLRQIMDVQNLEEKKMVYLESMGIVLILFNKFLLKKTYPSKTTVKFWDRFLIPVSRMIDKLIVHSVGKSVIGVWQLKKA